MINKERYELQEQALKALEQSNFRGWALMPTGSGKTVVIINCLKYLQPKSVVYFCDNTRLRDVDFPNELIKWDAEEWIDKVQRVCYQTAYKWHGRKFDLGIFDEGDYFLSPEYIKTYYNNTFKHIILVSATLSDEKRKLAEEIAPIVFEKNIAEIVDAKIVNGEQIYFVNYELTPHENIKYLSYNEVFKRLLNEFKPNTFKLQQVQLARKHFLAGLLSTRHACGKLLKKLYYENDKNKILVFCELTEQADKITKYTYHAKNADKDNLSKFINGETRVLGVVGKIDRGVNIEGINNVIFASPSRSKTKLLQRSGRSRRLDVDDIVHLFFLIPYYKDRRGDIKPTIVESWVYQTLKDFNLEHCKIINYEKG